MSCGMSMMIFRLYPIWGISVCKAIYFEPALPSRVKSRNFVVRCVVCCVYCNTLLTHQIDSRFGSSLTLVFGWLDRERKNGNNNNKVKRVYRSMHAVVRSKFCYFSLFVSLLCFIIIISSVCFGWCCCCCCYVVYCSLLSFSVVIPLLLFTLLVLYIFRRVFVSLFPFICCAFSLFHESQEHIAE